MASPTTRAGRQRRLTPPHTSLSKRFEFDPATTWRRRRRDEINVLSAVERRYLLDLLAQIEASNGTLGDELRVLARRMARSGTRRPARPLVLLIQRGLLIATNKNGTLHAVITRDGAEIVQRWLAAKPPDFITRFPHLYRTLGFCKEIPGITARALRSPGIIRVRRKS